VRPTILAPGRAPYAIDRRSGWWQLKVLRIELPPERLDPEKVPPGLTPIAREALGPGKKV
jgi:hypothetical protein